LIKDYGVIKLIIEFPMKRLENDKGDGF